MIIVYWGVGWFIGIGLASLWELPVPLWLTAAAVALAAAVLLRRRPYATGLLVALAAAGAGGARYTAAVPTIDAGHVAHYNDTGEVVLTGLVVDEPDVRDRAVQLRVQIDSLTVPGEEAQPVEGDVLVRTFRFPVIPYGARLRLSGELETPPEDEDFSYKAYLARQGINC